MNRKLIIIMLGALLMIEAAAMVPALLVSFIYKDGDTMPLVYSIAINLIIGSARRVYHNSPGMDFSGFVWLPSLFAVRIIQPV